jgi:hypothetical protein
MTAKCAAEKPVREEAWEPESCDYLRQIVKGFLFVILVSPAKEEGQNVQN